MRLGIDIDGVIADSLQTWVRELNRQFGQQKTLPEIISYQFDKVYNVTWKKMDRFFRTNQELLLTNLAPVAEAKEYMELLKQTHELYLITARPNLYRNLTISWLREHNIVYDELLMTDYGDKTTFCHSAQIALVVEDSLENALALANEGIGVILFDAPYNQGTLPDKVLRRKNWPDVYRTVTQMTLHQG